MSFRSRTGTYKFHRDSNAGLTTETSQATRTSDIEIDNPDKPSIPLEMEAIEEKNRLYQTLQRKLGLHLLTQLTSKQMIKLSKTMLQSMWQMMLQRMLQSTIKLRKLNKNLNQHLPRDGFRLCFCSWLQRTWCPTPRHSSFWICSICWTGSRSTPWPGPGWLFGYFLQDLYLWITSLILLSTAISIQSSKSSSKNLFKERNYKNVNPLEVFTSGTLYCIRIIHMLKENSGLMKTDTKTQAKTF